MKPIEAIGATLICVLLLFGIVTTAEDMGRKSADRFACSRALDRSHTAADTATVYRLTLCQKEER